jgi:hypothetical protein
VLGALMLSLGVKLARERGEAIEKEKRYIDRITRVKLELAALDDGFPSAFETELRKVDTPLTVKNFFQSEAGKDLLKSCSLRALERAKETAKDEFEKQLWEKADDAPNDVPEEKVVKFEKPEEEQKKNKVMY